MKVSNIIADPWALPADCLSVIVKREAIASRSLRGVEEFIRTQSPSHQNGALFVLTRTAATDMDVVLADLARWGLQPGRDFAIADMAQGPLIECPGIVFISPDKSGTESWTVNAEIQESRQPFRFPQHRIRAWYADDIVSANGDLSYPIGQAVLNVDDETLARIRSGEEVEVDGPKIAFGDEGDLPARWVFNIRGPGSGMICLSYGDAEEPEFLEVTSMQFDDDPTIRPAPPMFEC